MWAAVLTPVESTGSYLMTEAEPVLVLDPHRADR